ncbi:MULTISPECIES: protein phosphatase 2C domain-containing protein [unclassified Thermoactinomyces]|jgi:serine/threonine protein phosphatase PrpC|uniref:protein phosphatase 2C domain-containing protein n=1 Tax=unclassified Thermoactinomyces TaxID=2634588 RepID=UPI0018DCB029|nr:MULTISPECIES: protein phosphatase 2C domain-containing protein [unclassified Thermoactinomyces]MBH8586385.1 protein phosphatase 2C domain-containing protein [Thermoactinomyces sp. CICC 10520]MBI0391987.1 protein phosphatase 2C domain-containing protein [Thermoactinomyces sp. CICC 24226]
MKIKIRSLTNKNPHKLENEDLIGWYKNYYWVLDGASVPKGLNVPMEISTGWYVSKLNEGIIRAISSLREPFDLKDILRFAINYILENSTIKQFRNSGDIILPSSTIGMVKIEENFLQYMVLGDSLILSDVDQQIRCFTDERLKQIGRDMRNEINKLLKLGNGYQSNSVNKIKLDLVKLESSLRNTEEGYWIASEDPKAAEKAYTGKIFFEKNKDKHVLLMTDGFARAVTTLELFYSWKDMLYFITENGLEPCLERIRKTEKNDPNGQYYPRFKQFDDASALLLKIN